MKAGGDGERREAVVPWSCRGRRLDEAEGKAVGAPGVPALGGRDRPPEAAAHLDPSPEPRAPAGGGREGDPHPRGPRGAARASSGERATSWIHPAVATPIRPWRSRRRRRQPGLTVLLQRPLVEHRAVHGVAGVVRHPARGALARTRRVPPGKGGHRVAARQKRVARRSRCPGSGWTSSSWPWTTSDAVRAPRA